MSFSNLYEYMHGEFQDVTRVPLAAAGVDPAWIIDPNGVKIAGHQIELWDAETGGAQLLEGVDYSLVFLDSGKTAAEGIDIWAGYQVINVAYQGIPLYLTARIIGGYTKHNGGIIFDEAIGDQWVTRWDTGRMELSARNVGGTIVNPYSVVFAVQFVAVPTFLATVYSSGNRVVSVGSGATTGFDASRFIADTGEATGSGISWHAIGRWK